MLQRLAHIQTAINPSEKDEIIGDLLSQLMAAKQVIAKYVDAHGVLPEFRVPAKKSTDVNAAEPEPDAAEPEAGG